MIFDTWILDDFRVTGAGPGPGCFRLLGNPIASRFKALSCMKRAVLRSCR